MRWWLGKGSNTALFDLSSEHLVSRDEGKRAEQSHEKRIKRDLPAGWLLLNSQTQPQKFPFLKPPEQPESRKTVFLVTQQKPVELDRKKPTKSGCPSCHVKMTKPHFPPDPSFILSVASKAQIYEH